MGQDSSISQNIRILMEGRQGGVMFFWFFGFGLKKWSGYIHISLLIKVWFTDQNSKPQEIEDKININLIID